MAKSKRRFHNQKNKRTEPERNVLALSGAVSTSRRARHHGSHHLALVSRAPSCARSGAQATQAGVRLRSDWFGTPAAQLAARSMTRCPARVVRTRDRNGKQQPKALLDQVIQQDLLVAHQLAGDRAIACTITPRLSMTLGSGTPYTP